MALFKRGSSLLEVQNRALIKTAQERAAQIDRLERDLQGLQGRLALFDACERELRGVGQIEQFEGERAAKLEHMLRSLQTRVERQSEEIERLTLERDYYSKRVSVLEGENRELTESATSYSTQAQKLQRELTEVATRYSLRAQQLQRELTEVATKYSLRAQHLERELTETGVRAHKTERELTETATKYSLWGQKLERELARIDPNGVAARRFDAHQEA
jgi:chromosome segregation ATPase